MGSERFIITGMARDGQAEAFADLAERMSISVSANEPDTATYDWFVADDGSLVNEDEYTSSDALSVHLGNAQESGMLDEYMALSDIAAVHTAYRRPRPLRPARRLPCAVRLLPEAVG